MAGRFSDFPAHSERFGVEVARIPVSAFVLRSQPRGELPCNRRTRWVEPLNTYLGWFESGASCHLPRVRTAVVPANAGVASDAPPAKS